MFNKNFDHFNLEVGINQKVKRDRLVDPPLDQIQFVKEKVSNNPKLLFCPQYEKWREYFYINDHQFYKSIWEQLLPEEQDKILQNDQTSDNWNRFGNNFLKSPGAALFDAMLWGLDKLGAPTNATNFIRDVPNATKYKAGAAVSASAKTVWDYVNGNESNFDDNYEFYTKKPFTSSKICNY